MSNKQILELINDELVRHENKIRLITRWYKCEADLFDDERAEVRRLSGMKLELRQLRYSILDDIEREADDRF